MRARFIAVAWVCLAETFFDGTVAAQSQPPALEHQVKTSYLYNFMHFVVWPEDVFGEDGKFNLCVVAGNRYDSVLDALIAERVDGHEIAVHKLDDPTQTGGVRCHLLFLARDKFGLAPKTLAAEHGVLTIGDMPGFLERGGIINLVEVRGKIRFEVNQTAAQRAGLTISSKLLELSMRLL